MRLPKLATPLLLSFPNRTSWVRRYSQSCHGVTSLFRLHRKTIPFRGGRCRSFSTRSCLERSTPYELIRTTDNGPYEDFSLRGFLVQVHSRQPPSYYMFTCVVCAHVRICIHNTFFLRIFPNE